MPVNNFILENGIGAACSLPLPGLVGKAVRHGTGLSLTGVKLLPRQKIVTGSKLLL